MNSLERVLTAFRHEEADRVPRWCGASDEFWARAKRELDLDDEGLRLRFGDDFRRAYATYQTPEQPLREGVTCRTIFGVEHHGIGCGQALTHPLAGATIREVHEYAWPDPACVDVSTVRAQAEKYGREYAILGGDWSPYWHDAIDLVGMEALYMKMYDEPEFVDVLMRAIVDFYVASNVKILDAAVDVIDILFLGNDFGGQSGPLVSPQQFDRFLLPHLKRLIDLGHDYGLPVQLHCCGGYEPLIPAMIECGLDALHAVQPCCRGMDLRELKGRYGSQIVFNGAIDSQHVLIEGESPEFVRRKTREVLEIMAPGGGYIAGASHDTVLDETPLDHVLAMFDTIEEWGGY